MKFCVIGLGRFGYQVATVLAENGMDVMAIDDNENTIASIRDQVTHAICMRVADEESLRDIGVHEMDTVIVAMGEAFAQSILLTALLKKKLGIERIIARGTNEIHKEILQLVGADQVILPEKEIGIRVADYLSSPFVDLMRLTKEFSISHILAPADVVDRSIRDVGFFENYQIRCIGIRQGEEVIPVGHDYVIKAGDKLVCAGRNDELEKFAGR